MVKSIAHLLLALLCIAAVTACDSASDPAAGGSGDDSVVDAAATTSTVTNEPAGASQPSPSSPADATATAVQAKPPATTADEPTRFNEVRDEQLGIVQLRSPIPRSWQVHATDAEVYITGARGLKVHKTERYEFVWSPDPFMQQTMLQAGKNVGQPLSVRQILDLQVKPAAEGQGYRYLRSFDVPGVEGFWHRFFAAMPQDGSRRTVEAMATEWDGPDENKSMILLVKTTVSAQQSMFWQVSSTHVEAPAAEYEPTKQAYLYAVANTEMNPQWMAAKNQALQASVRHAQQYWQQAGEISRAAHEQRMQAITARGAAAQSVGQTYSDILDISHKGYLTRSQINDQGHSRSVQAATNTSIIGNHETGEHYNVDGNNKYYWVNNDGLYIATDNPLFDPRTNEQTREDKWTRFHKEP